MGKWRSYSVKAERKNLIQIEIRHILETPPAEVLIGEVSETE